MRRLSETAVTRSRELRRKATDVERLLWRELRMRQIESFRFRRQHPIGDFIADFACVEARLVIEVDGSQHMAKAGYDTERSRHIEERGYRVLRFWNNDVTENIAGVKERILEALRDYPHPGLPPERGKG